MKNVFQLLICLCLAITYVSCDVSSSNQGDAQSETAQAEDHDHEGHDHDDHDHADTSDEGDGVHFGDKITADNAISYDELLLKMEGLDSMQTKVMGTVDEVCQKKGCWMTIITADENKESMMVQFKDYGFFMPMDISGRTVVMEGTAYRSITPAEELRHYAEDAGKSAAEIAQITEPKEELKFLASGVVLTQ